MEASRRGLARCEEALLAGGVLGVATLTIVNVLARTFAGFSIAAAEELCQFGLIWVTFIGLSYAAARGRHIRMTALYDTLAAPVRRKLRIAICLSTGGLLLMLTWVGVSYVATVKALGTVSPALRVPLWLVYLGAPLGLGMAALHYLAAALANARSENTVYIAVGIPEGSIAPAEAE